ncbi:MAG: DUF1080 domain-containing protein [Phycisphaerae bacterium]|nr:DUF1080 domain-containing protein [Phycisphaerae bacterium]
MRTIVTIGLVCCAVFGLSCAKKPSSSSPNASAPQFVNMLDEQLSQWTVAPGSWEFKDGVLARTGKGNLWTKKPYGNFIIELEYKVPSDSNSGIMFRCSDPEDWVYSALESQIHVTTDGTVHGQCAAIYDCASPDFVEIARLQVTMPDGKTQDLPLADAITQKMADGSTLTITKRYNNYQIAKKDGKEVPYEGSQSKSNPAVVVSFVAPDGKEEKATLIGDKPVKTEKGYTLNYRLEKTIADKEVRKPAEEWSRMKLTANNNLIEVELNGRKVLTMDLDQWTTAGFNPDGTPNKYANPVKDHPRSGLIGLQDHGTPVWFRNVKIAELP